MRKKGGKRKGGGNAGHVVDGTSIQFKRAITNCWKTFRLEFPAAAIADSRSQKNKTEEGGGKGRGGKRGRDRSLKGEVHS